MELTAILSAIDTEISKLQQVRAMLSGGAPVTVQKKRGRPKGSKSVAIAPVAKASKRVLSDEARAKIAAAQKKRWAAAKKAAK